MMRLLHVIVVHVCVERYHIKQIVNGRFLFGYLNKNEAKLR